MGEKPLYLWEEGERVYFASELKSLIGGIPRMPALAPPAVDLFFHWNYIPEPYTPLEGVRKLPAGHLLVIDVDSWRVEQKQYWDMACVPPLEGDPVEAIRAELYRISEIIIRADVPIGIALSGGVDSGALAVLAARHYPGTIHAFTVGYEGRPPNDERDQAQVLAKRLGMPFHEVEIRTDDFVRFFPELMRHTDDPISDIAGYGYYMVSRLAREHGVPVLLQGQGGDELFWGYPWVKQATIENIARLHPSCWRRWWGCLTQGRNATVHDAISLMDRRRAFQVAAEWKDNELYPKAFAEGLSPKGPYEPMRTARPREDLPVLMTRLISQTYLLENGLAQSDRLSMASSVELRLPLVDYRLVEVVIGHRRTRPDHHLPSKAWLREALQDVLPGAVTNRPKSGFTPPTYEWYRALVDAYGSKLAHGYLVSVGVLTPGAAGRLARGEALGDGVIPLPYKALCLEMWCRGVLAGERTYV
jgi:asparagine synthase (glutamine-hydrolysing)